MLVMVTPLRSIFVALIGCFLLIRCFRIAKDSPWGAVLGSTDALLALHFLVVVVLFTWVDWDGAEPIIATIVDAIVVASLAVSTWVMFRDDARAVAGRVRCKLRR